MTTASTYDARTSKGAGFLLGDDVHQSLDKVRLSNASCAPFYEEWIECEGVINSWKLRIDQAVLSIKPYRLVVPEQAVGVIA